MDSEKNIMWLLNVCFRLLFSHTQIHTTSHINCGNACMENWAYGTKQICPTSRSSLRGQCFPVAESERRLSQPAGNDHTT